MKTRWIVSAIPGLRSVPFAPALATPAADLSASLAGPAAALAASIAAPASPSLAADSPVALAPTPSDTPNRFPLLPSSYSITPFPFQPPPPPHSRRARAVTVDATVPKLHGHEAEEPLNLLELLGQRGGGVAPRAVFQLCIQGRRGYPRASRSARAAQASLRVNEAFASSLTACSGRGGYHT